MVQSTRNLGNKAAAETLRVRARGCLLLNALSIELRLKKNHWAAAYVENLMNNFKDKCLENLKMTLFIDLFTTPLLFLPFHFDFSFFSHT